MVTDLTENLAEDLAEDLAGEGAWRDQLLGLVANWRYGYGETLVSGELDTWTDTVGGYVFTAETASRAEDGGNHWFFDAAGQPYYHGAEGLATGIFVDSAHTVLIMCAPSALGTADTPFGYADGTTNGHEAYFQKQSADDAWWWVRKDVSAKISVSRAMGAAGHVLLAGTCAGSGGDQTIGLNDLGVDDTDAASPAQTNNTRCTIGRRSRSSGGQAFTGKMYEIMVFDRVLADSEIADIYANMTAELWPWTTIEALPGLVAAFDPARGRALGTGVSDWTDQVAGIVASQGTGSQQPTYTGGACPSGAPALQFSLASSQALVAAAETAILDVANAENICIYLCGRTTSTTANTRLVSLGYTTGSDEFNMRQNVSGGTRYESIGGAGSYITQFATANTDTDEWIYMFDDGTLTGGRTRGQAESSNTRNQTYSVERLAIGARYANATSNYADMDVYAVLFFKLDEIDHAATQAALDALMGL